MTGRETIHVAGKREITAQLSQRQTRKGYDSYSNPLVTVGSAEAGGGGHEQ